MYSENKAVQHVRRALKKVRQCIDKKILPYSHPVQSKEDIVAWNLKYDKHAIRYWLSSQLWRLDGIVEYWAWVGWVVTKQKHELRVYKELFRQRPRLRPLRSFFQAWETMRNAQKRSLKPA
jgi:hypothetical protein